MLATPRAWIDGLRRHVEDLRTDSYEGAAGPEREARYRAAFDLLSIVATGVLADVNQLLLGGTGDISIQPPGPDGHGGLVRTCMLSTAALRAAERRFLRKRLVPRTLRAGSPAESLPPALCPRRRMHPPPQP